jgi:hypothetical protein
MRLSICLIIAAALAACSATPVNLASFQTLQNRCLPSSWPAFGPCVRHMLDTERGGWARRADGDLVESYVSWLEAAGRSVQYGSMTDTEAAEKSAAMWDQTAAAFAQRENARQSIAASNMALGIALLQSSAPPPMPVPSAPVHCTTSAPNRITGATYTTCL